MTRKEQEKSTQELTTKLIKKIDEDPYDEQAYYALGTVLTEQKSYEQAEELFKRALNAVADKPQKLALLHYGLGNVYYASALYDEALKEFSLVNDKDLQAQAYLMLAQTYYAKENYQKALAFAMTADQLESTLTTLGLMGDCFLALGDFNQAKAMYLQALAKNTTDARINFQLGVLAVVDGEDPSKYFDQAKKSDPRLYQKLNERLKDVEQVIQATNKKK